MENRGNREIEKWEIGKWEIEEIAKWRNGGTREMEQRGMGN